MTSLNLCVRWWERAIRGIRGLGFWRQTRYRVIGLDKIWWRSWCWKKGSGRRMGSKTMWRQKWGKRSLRNRRCWWQSMKIWRLQRAQRSIWTYFRIQRLTLFSLDCPNIKQGTNNINNRKALSQTFQQFRNRSNSCPLKNGWSCSWSLCLIWNSWSLTFSQPRWNKASCPVLSPKIL